MAIPTIKLNNDMTIPQIGLGLWKVTKEAECKEAVKAALQAGYTHFDTARYYGNEQYLGEALKEAGVARDGVFITTKIRNDRQDWDYLIPSYEESLQKLQMDHVDILLLHFPVTELRRPAWRRMEQLYRNGRVKSHVQ